MRVVAREAEPDLDAAARLARLADGAEGGARARPCDRGTGIGRQRPVEQLDGMVVVVEQPKRTGRGGYGRTTTAPADRSGRASTPAGSAGRPPSYPRARRKTALGGCACCTSLPRERAPSHISDRAPSRARTSCVLHQTARSRSGTSGRARAARIHRHRGSPAACAARGAVLNPAPAARSSPPRAPTTRPAGRRCRRPRRRSGRSRSWRRFRNP